MSVLKNSKHELFAQAIVKGSRTSDAYRIAGYAAKNDNTAAASASRLLNDVKIQARVAELKERAASGVVLTRQWVLERLMRNAMIALGEQAVKVKSRNKDTGEVVENEITQRDAAAANRALELLGKTNEAPTFIDRKQVEVGGPGAFDQMTIDELRDHIAREDDMIGLFESDAGSEAIN